MLDPEMRSVKIQKTKKIQQSEPTRPLSFPSRRARIPHRLHRRLTPCPPLLPDRLDRDSYLVFDIPSAEDRRRDCWDLFTNDQETDWWAVNADSEAAEGYFIGRLNLERLGIKNRFFRRNETLKTVYIAKPERPA